MNFDDVDIADLADVIDDPFERREVKRALDEFAAGVINEDERQLVLRYSDELMRLNHRDMNTLLAVLGDQRALMKALLGG